MDRSVTIAKPSDLAKFAYGKWLTQTPIPSEKPLVDNFDSIQERNRLILHRILDHAAADRSAKPSSAEGRCGTFFRVAMNEKKADRLGLGPISRELHLIGAIRSRKDLIRAIGELQANSVPVAFAAAPQQDDLNENRMLGTFIQGGQILPDRETYWNKEGAPLRKAYLTAGAKLFTLAGSDQPQVRAALALHLETQLARISSTPVELRDIPANYHDLTRKQFQALTPSIDWQRFGHGAGFLFPTEVNVGQLKFFKGLDALVRSASLSEWRSYLTMQLLNTTAPYLSDEAAKAQFGITSAVYGQPEREVRWKRAISSTDTSIGEALGPLYIQSAFSQEARTKARTLVHFILEALRDRIPQLDWMGAETKKRAIAKLSKFLVKVGYPDKWRDYSALHLREDSWAGNVMRAFRFEWNRQWAKLGKPIDRSEWGMTVAQVNAYYNQYNNEIVFPAGILQKGFFDPTADDALNYGGIGMAIGHEITHGFDDQGSLFDGNGRRANWWTAADRKNFEAAGDGLVRQYGSLTNAFGTKLNGKLTLGENMADVGGLAIAFLAYEKSLGGKSSPTIDGLTGEQRFFVSASQSFRGKYRKAYGDADAATDPHSPDDIRSYVPAGDQPGFYKAFGLAIPEHLPHVW